MRYKIIKKDRPEDLELEIQDHLNNGWLISGGPQYWYNNDRMIAEILQAVVHRDDVVPDEQIPGININVAVPPLPAAPGQNEAIWIARPDLEPMPGFYFQQDADGWREVPIPPQPDFVPAFGLEWYFDYEVGAWQLRVHEALNEVPQF